MNWIKRWEVKSQTSGKNYIVAVTADGIYGCSCPQWKFKRNECKHILHIKASEKPDDLGVMLKAIYPEDETFKDAQVINSVPNIKYKPIQATETGRVFEDGNVVYYPEDFPMRTTYEKAKIILAMKELHATPSTLKQLKDKYLHLPYTKLQEIVG